MVWSVYPLSHFGHVFNLPEHFHVWFDIQGLPSLWKAHLLLWELCGSKWPWLFGTAQLYKAEAWTPINKNRKKIFEDIDFKEVIYHLVWKQGRCHMFGLQT